MWEGGYWNWITTVTQAGARIASLDPVLTGEPSPCSGDCSAHRDPGRAGLACRISRSQRAGSVHGLKVLYVATSRGKKTKPCLFGCCRIHFNPCGLVWIEVEFSSNFIQIHLNILHPNKVSRLLLALET
jgi:hypothetical protein